MPTSFYLFHSAARGGGTGPRVDLNGFDSKVNNKSGIKDWLTTKLHFPNGTSLRKNSRMTENGELQSILDRSSSVSGQMADVCLLRDSPFRILRVSNDKNVS